MKDYLLNGLKENKESAFKKMNLKQIRKFIIKLRKNILKDYEKNDSM